VIRLYFSVPFRSSRFFSSTKITGVMINTWMAEVIMPPIIGAAIGFMTSAPEPDDHMIGISPGRATATVISLGRSRSTAPSNVAS